MKIKEMLSQNDSIAADDDILIKVVFEDVFVVDNNVAVFSCHLKLETLDTTNTHQTTIKSVIECEDPNLAH